MGVYINPGNEGFRQIVADEYVDKTGLIALVNKAIGKPRPLVCVTRPRRFGKSFSAQMLTAYYCQSCDSTQLFSGLAIQDDSTFGQHLNKYHVVRLDLTSFTSSVGADVVPLLSERLHDDLAREFPDLALPDGIDLALLEVVRATGRKIVFVIDEWDAPLREAEGDGWAKDRWVRFLRMLFKNASFTPEAVAAAYMTGILPIKKYGTQSALSDFREYTMLDPSIYAPYVGFTEQEVRALCERHAMDFSGMQRWYDGYDLPGVGVVYAPNSVVESCRRHRFGSYWSSTESYTSLARYIQMDFGGLQGMVADLIAGERIPVNTLLFRNDMDDVQSADDVLTLLAHLGYLAYEEESQTVRIPNEEVRLEFASTIRVGGNPVLARMVADADQLLAATIEGDEAAVAAGIARAHDSRLGPDWYNDEQALRFAVKLAYLTAVDKFAEIDELPSGHGYADIVYLPKRYARIPALVVELKWSKPVASALDQIHERNYPKVLEDYGGPLLLVAVTYDAKTKEHSCVIERMRK